MPPEGRRENVGVSGSRGFYPSIYRIIVARDHVRMVLAVTDWVEW